MIQVANFYLMLLLLPQRYEFSSKSQLGDHEGEARNGCCCYRKGTNFQANHNKVPESRRNCALLLLPQRYEFSSKSQLLLGCVQNLLVVVATAKVRIFKQITTCWETNPNEHLLLLLPQRYEFSSKSQQKMKRYLPNISCCCYRKGTNFQANHNWCGFGIYGQRLLLLPQRYEFSSKSQPPIGNQS